MALRVLWRWWREALVSLYRNAWIAASAAGMVLVTLFLLGFVALFALNAAHFSRLIENQVEVAVFLQDDLAPDLVRQLGRELRQITGVSKVTFVSKEEALAKLKRDLGDRSGLLSGLEEKNPLPDSFRLRPTSAAAVPSIAREAAALPGVEKVRYGEGVVEKLVKITSSVRIAALALVALFGLAAVFLIVTTIRLSILSRQEEIGIMRLLGATNWFIRGPFVLEGLIIGASGAFLASGLLYWGYTTLVGQIEHAALVFFRPVTEATLLLPLFGAIVGIGFFIGALASMLSVHRFLTV